MIFFSGVKERMKISEIIIRNTIKFESVLGKPTCVLKILHRKADNSLPRCQELFHSQTMNGNTNL